MDVGQAVEGGIAAMAVLSGTRRSGRRAVLGAVFGFPEQGAEQAGALISDPFLRSYRG
jgi:hypothetical protein